MKIIRQNDKGVTLIELLVVLAIFSVVMAGLYSSFVVQMRRGTQEFGFAESDMDLLVARNIIERDMSLAGFGIAEDYDFDGDGTQNFTPLPVSGTDGNPDTFTLRGTALGRFYRTSQAWSFVTGNTPMSFQTFSDSRENLRTDDVVILVTPIDRKLWSSDGKWQFKFVGSNQDLKHINDAALSSSPDNGFITYGLISSGTASNPYSTVRYYLDGTSPLSCAPGTKNLMRAESLASDEPSIGEAILSCVADLEVAFGLNTLNANGEGLVDKWDNGGAIASSYGMKELGKRLKQIRFYALLQQGKRDTEFSYKNPDPDPSYFGTAKVRVGELSLAGGSTGRDVTLQANQMNYRWRVVSFVVTPRNIR